MRLKLTIAYDGGHFEGWQSQASAGAVQDALEAAFALLCGDRHRITVFGSGRTDSGVHALGQVAHVDVPDERFPLHRWQGALNAHLPRSLRIIGLQRTHADFHARFSATGKAYEYRFWNATWMHPLEMGRACHMVLPIDMAILRECANALTGTHDFAGFSAKRKNNPRENTVRTIHAVRTRKRGALVTITFQGNGFLYRMARILAGSTIRVAQGKAPMDWLLDLRDRKTSARSSFAAPAEGLYLKRVFYNRSKKMQLPDIYEDDD